MKYKNSQEEMFTVDLGNEKKNHLVSSLSDEKILEDFQEGVTKYDEILVLLEKEMESYRSGKISKTEFRKKVKAIVENEENEADTIPDNARKGS